MPRKKALIHIGTGKTGTSSIQIGLANAVAKGKLGGIAYPDLDPHFQCGSHYLTLFYMEEHLQPPWLKFLVRKSVIDVPSLQNRFRKILSENDNVILSSEFLPLASRHAIQQLKEELDAAGFSDYSIVIYLREPVSCYISLLQQMIKHSLLIYQPAQYNYLAIARSAIENFSDIFECDICVREFDREKLTGGDVVTDFSKLSSGFFEKDIELDSITSNESLSAEGVFIFHEYWKNLPFPDKFDNTFPDAVPHLLSQLRQNSQGTKISLRPNALNTIINQSSKDAEWFAHNHGIEFNTLSTQPRPNSVSDGRILSLEEIIVKPDDASIDAIKKRIAPPLPNFLMNMLRFLQSIRFNRKVLYGGGKAFLEVARDIWALDIPLHFDKIRLVDKNPGIRRCNEMTLSFGVPDDIDWNTVDAVLICTPAYDSEIREYLMNKNNKLAVYGLTGGTSLFGLDPESDYQDHG
jgi:hypothetical protein